MFEHCNQILKDGIFRTRQVESYDELKTFLRETLVLTYAEARQYNYTNNAGINISLGDFNFDGNDDRDKSDFLTLQTAYNADNERFLESTAGKRFFEKQADKNIVQAWLECVSGARQISLYREGGDDGTYVVRMTYHSINGGDPDDVELEGWQGSGCDVVPNSDGRIAQVGDHIHRGNDYTFTVQLRNPGIPATFRPDVSHFANYPGIELPASLLATKPQIYVYPRLVRLFTNSIPPQHAKMEDVRSRAEAAGHILRVGHQVVATWYNVHSGMENLGNFKHIRVAVDPTQNKQIVVQHRTIEGALDCAVAIRVYAALLME